MFICLNCGNENEDKKNCFSKFCNNACQADHRFRKETFPQYLLGEIKNRRTLHRCVKHEQGYVCALCDNKGEHNSMPLALQLDHIDGDAGNDMPSNLRLLCPNCHSQTTTYVAKNKGKGRTARGLPR